jgi:hypothetical protein
LQKFGRVEQRKLPFVVPAERLLFAAEKFKLSKDDQKTEKNKKWLL